MKNKLILIPVIVIISLILLLTIIILLLSILFPNELVRKQIEKQGTELLGTQVSLKKLKFSIFTGIKLENFKIAQNGTGWKNKYLIDIEKAVLSYRFFPLLKREISIKACTVEDGKINLERNQGKGNWEYFINKIQGKNNDKKSKQEEKDSDKAVNNKKQIFTSKTLPINIDIKKAGIEGLEINYFDNSFFDVPLNIKISETKLLGKNISVKQNKPFDLIGNISINLNAESHIILYANLKTEGKIKIFNDNNGEISPSGPIKITLTKAKFSSDDIKELFIEIIQNYLEETLGAAILDALKDPSIIINKSDDYFNTVLDNSDEKIQAVLSKSEELILKKEELLEYKNKLLSDFQRELESAVENIDNKLEKTGNNAEKIFSTAKKIPLIENFVEIEKYEKKLKKIRNRVKSEKKSLKSRYNKMQKDFDNKINVSFPDKIPDYSQFKNDFKKNIELYKKQLIGVLKNYSIELFLDSILGDLTFLDKEWNINELSTIYHLGKNDSEVKELKFKTKYFESYGQALIKNKNIDYTGDVTAMIEEFELDFLPVNSVKTKLKIYGEIPDLKIEFVDIPDIQIDGLKSNEMIESVINRYLISNYNADDIISNVMEGYKIQDINIDEIKNFFDRIKNNEINLIEKEESEILDYIENQVYNLTEELKSKVPGL